jgi:hypothetical protein
MAQCASLIAPCELDRLNRRDEGYGSGVRRDDGGVFCSRLFNIARCDGLPDNEPVPGLPEPERDARAEQGLLAARPSAFES